MNLNDRFLNFCKQYPGAEDIDELAKSFHVPDGVKKADFFFQGRTIVCEVKTLTEETEYKLVTYMRENGIDPSALPAGQHVIKELFLPLDEGARKYRKAMNLITNPIAKGLDDAEKQIRDTKKWFDLPNSDGLLIILNDIVGMAGPPIVWERLEQRLRKSEDDGSPSHGNVNQILHIGEKYVPDGQDQCLAFTRPNLRAAEKNGVAGFVVEFIEAWAAFNGRTFTLGNEREGRLLQESQLFVTIKESKGRQCGWS